MENTRLSEIIDALENIERNNLSDDPQIRAWLKHITNVDFRLVESLINVINENISNNKLITDILKVLR
jgi:hypothetical protein